MKKALGILLLVAGIAGIALGGYEFVFDETKDDCLRFREQAIELLDQAIAAGEGTERANELVAEAEGKSAMADSACGYAAEDRQMAIMIMIGGLVAAGVGFVLMRRRRAVPPATA